MGAAHSTASALGARNELLGRLAGPEPLDNSTTYWEQLLNLPVPLASLNPADVEDAILPHCRQLLVHNPLTYNFQKLVLHVLDLIDAAEKGSSSQAVANSLHMLAAIIKCTAATASPAALSGLFAVSASLPASVQASCAAAGHATLMPLFTGRVLQLITLVEPTDDMSFLVLLESCKLLLACASTQLYTQNTGAPPEAHPLMEVVMGHRKLAVPLVGALLQLMVSQPPEPPRLHLYKPPDSNGYSVVRLVQSAAATVFWIPMRTYNLIWRHSGGPADSSSCLSDAALVLLLVLVHFPSYHHQQVNGIKEALRGLRDESLSADGGPEDGRSNSVMALGSPLVSFARLYEYCAAGPANEAVTLLLYTLIHGSQSFLDYVLVRSDVETLLMPVLQQLYLATKRRPNHLYMLQIILLILSQDTSFSHNIHKVFLPGGVPWYKERLLGKLSLGSMVYIVLLRTAMQNMGPVSDVYLPTNTLAALANLAPQVTGLHSHAAQRLVGLTSSLGKRLIKVERNLAELQAAGQPTEQLEGEVQVLADFLRIMLEITNCILATGLQRNPELVYALLHKQEVFGALRQHPRLVELVDNIQLVIEYFNSRLDAMKSNAAAAPEGQGDWSVAKVLGLINSFAQGWRSERLRPFADLRFVYEEEAAPEEFFVPYVWSLAVTATAHGLYAWDFSSLALLTPLMSLGVDTGSGALDEQGSVPTPRWSDAEAALSSGFNVQNSGSLQQAGVDGQQPQVL